MTISLEFPPHAWNIIYKHVFPQFFFHGKTANLALRKAKIPKSSLIGNSIVVQSYYCLKVLKAWKWNQKVIYDPKDV